jgi:hypothetical protein
MGQSQGSTWHTWCTWGTQHTCYLGTWNFTWTPSLFPTKMDTLIELHRHREAIHVKEGLVSYKQVFCTR